MKIDRRSHLWICGKLAPTRPPSTFPQAPQVRRRATKTVTDVLISFCYRCPDSVQINPSPTTRKERRGGVTAPQSGL